jgi:NADH-quinone oxidoreductase subunit A
MPSDFLPIAVLLLLSIGLAFLVVILGHTFGPRRPNPRKDAPYESGMRPYGAGRRRMPVHFYVVAVLFILFDIEIIFMLPWAVVLNEIKLVGLIEMFLFVGILFVGLIYAWKIGALEWD